MAFDGFVTKAVVNELNKNIIDARVEKVNMPTKFEVILILHNCNQKYKLLLSINPTNARIHFTNLNRENPIKAFQFCMILRKYLQGSKIINVKQHNLDRIVIITFEGLDDFGDKKKFSLITELMGKHSNIILTNEENKILDSIRHVDSEISSLREILPAREYIFPQNQERDDFIGMSIQEFTNSISEALLIPGSDNFDFSKRLANQFTGFSRTFTNHLCSKFKISSEISKATISDIYSNINILLHNIDQRLAQLIEINNDYHFDLSVYSTNSCSPTPISDFLDKYYCKKENKENLHNRKMELQREIFKYMTRYQKNLDRVNEIICDSENAEYYKQCGELITSNIYRMKQGMSQIEVENFYDNNNIEIIRLNQSYSPAKNAQIYFKKYAKLKLAITHATQQKKDYEDNIYYLENISYQINECEQLGDLLEIKEELISQNILKQPVRKKNDISNAHSDYLKYEKDGIEILVGKNNIQNDKITFKIANKTDTWLHTKNIHGSHVIIRSEIVSDDILTYAAKLASNHSQAKGLGKVEIDYTLVKNVKKFPGAKPGMVIYSDYHTIVV